jgi:hypothetical protein
MAQHVKVTETDKQEKAKYELDLEGTLFEWTKGTISMPEIRELAGWGADQPIVEVDLKSGAEETLTEDAVIELKPGHGFGKKVRFQRG